MILITPNLFLLKLFHHIPKTSLLVIYTVPTVLMLILLIPIYLTALIVFLLKINCVTFSGDFNLDILQYDTNNRVNTFVNNFYSHDMFPLIDRPTRIVKNSATILDNIFTNVLDKQIKSGIFVNDITDHYPVFQVTNTIDLHKVGPKFINYRSFNKDNINCFKNYLQLTDWDYYNK